jgi:hypothetical protein
MLKTRIPIFLTSSVLAGLTVLLTVPPLNMPNWVIFVTWGATFLLGSPNIEGIKSLWPPLLAGTSLGVAFLWLYGLGTALVGGNVVLSTLLAGVIVFCITTVVFGLSRISVFSVMGAMFIGFPMLVGTVVGGFGFAPHSLFTYWVSATLMCFLGPVLAWASEKLTLPIAVKTTEQKVKVAARL